MNNAKLVSTPLTNHFKLTKEMYPKTNKEKENMGKVPYTSSISILIYAMVYTRPNITQVVRVMRRYMSNLAKEYW